jgi:hypothetical protein
VYLYLMTLGAHFQERPFKAVPGLQRREQFGQRASANINLPLNLNDADKGEGAGVVGRVHRVKLRSLHDVEAHVPGFRIQRRGGGEVS